MVVVGCGGGPDETNLSGYLLKPYDSRWEDGIIALEAGSGQGALSHILAETPSLFSSERDQGPYSVAKIYSYVRCFLITHAHLDHVNSLEGLFNGRIWPNLASWKDDDDENKLLYKDLPLDLPSGAYHTIFPSVSVRTFLLNHGLDESNAVYQSSAFFIRHDTSKKEFLFFGDVEPDSIAKKAQNKQVWKEAASKIPEVLSTIFIECSWEKGRPNNLLFGHLSPEHLVDELESLAKEVEAVKIRKGYASGSDSSPQRKKPKRNSVDTGARGVLNGVRIYIIHCKDVKDGAQNLRAKIVDQVRKLIEPKGLGLQIFAAEQGIHISECFPLPASGSMAQCN
ncbi:cAMP phosphodiesterases class-II-domain-containing protein [Desarmillaria tabescens]|uniref:cAMP phosphodiesterases class-II-domain-containing protein n=1 Tax=Armillaria tabescens TaxID=1929756 RepID=A0AA39MWG2_ARMTA|nr:cAMP phosphodiesterases class-II-domain-containing protein [Desarmillaria tabescens]KAK0448370.1 cAMP phosphodiesterases class-II-domain-containing protein [Desarmillaria tabescens]